MGRPNNDRIPIWRRRSKVETVGDMLRERWNVVSKCGSCGLVMKVDLRLIAKVSGPRTSLWNRRPRCRRMYCGGHVEFQARVPGVGWHEALTAPWPEGEPEGR